MDVSIACGAPRERKIFALIYAIVICYCLKLWFHVKTKMIMKI